MTSFNLNHHLKGSIAIHVRPHGLQPTRLLCPRDFPGKNGGVGCYFLLQGTFSTNGSDPHLQWQVDSSPLHHLGSPESFV